MPLFVRPSGYQPVDALLWGYRWNSGDITYRFPVNDTDYRYTVLLFQGLDSQQADAARKALAMFDDVCGLNITRARPGAHPTLRFAEAAMIDPKDGSGIEVIQTASARPPDPRIPTYAQGDIFFNDRDFNSPDPGSYAFTTFMHEIGHAVGLKHGNEDWGYGALPEEYDSLEYSVMTYRDHVGDEIDHFETEEGGAPTTLMMLDIAALQHLYGADYTTNARQTTYSWSPTTGEMFVNGVGQGAPGANRIFLTVWDGGGSDTYDFSNYSTAVAVDLRPGESSVASRRQLSNLGDRVTADGNIYNALLHDGDTRSLIENAVGGAGDDALTGNQAANRLTGGAGADRLVGLTGDDSLTGGTSGDRFVFDDAWGSDTILDWQDGRVERRGADGLDVIDLSGLRDENGGASLALDDLKVRQLGTSVVISLDLDGDRVADRIDLDGDGTADPVAISVRNARAENFGAFDFVF